MPPRPSNPVLLARARGAAPAAGACWPPAATVIASQAVISGAFSVTQQAIQLGFMPRLRISHTSAQRARPDLHPGRQLGADGDGHPAGAVVPDLVEPRRGLWHRGHRRDARSTPACSPCVLFAAVELEPLPLVAAGDRGLLPASTSPISPRTSTKVPDGGWFPLLVGVDRLHPADHLGARAAG